MFRSFVCLSCAIALEKKWEEASPCAGQGRSGSRLFVFPSGTGIMFGAPWAGNRRRVVGKHQHSFWQCDVRSFFRFFCFTGAPGAGAHPRVHIDSFRDSPGAKPLGCLLPCSCKGGWWRHQQSQLVGFGGKSEPSSRRGLGGDTIATTSTLKIIRPADQRISRTCFHSI